MADVIPFWKLHHFTVTIQHFPQKLKTEKETLQNISLFEEKNLPAIVFLINIKVAKKCIFLKHKIGLSKVDFD